ncbi:hypothetical protein JL2886_00729 [Phaeobacter gallaeciensis]|uniref:Uncharacterized protein n=1 Tax=Phaeobacter gallaeciensis TaxID=60890 RepID=A0A1B0ZND1_9RHOB|nr:hypothetical protein JL2886_00729 [Phaeobacter gallaeciensis]
MISPVAVNICRASANAMAECVRAEKNSEDINRFERVKRA